MFPPLLIPAASRFEQEVSSLGLGSGDISMVALSMGGYTPLSDPPRSFGPSDVISRFGGGYSPASTQLSYLLALAHFRSTGSTSGIPYGATGMIDLVP